jgi:hypothetical protein
VDADSHKIHCIDTQGKLSEYRDGAPQAQALTVGPQDELYVATLTGDVMRYEGGQAPPVRVADGLPGQYILAMPNGSLYVSAPRGEVWLVKDGHKSKVDEGLKHAAGLACRPDQWLLSVADGGSRWVYSYQIGADGALINKERFFPLMVPDDRDDAGAAAVCYALENRMIVATALGLQICADDGPVQVVLPLPDAQAVEGVCLGGAQGDTLFAFAGGKIWTRKVKLHGLGAFSPWHEAGGSPL